MGGMDRYGGMKKRRHTFPPRPANNAGCSDALGNGNAGSIAQNGNGDSSVDLRAKYKAFLVNNKNKRQAAHNAKCPKSPRSESLTRFKQMQHQLSEHIKALIKKNFLEGAEKIKRSNLSENQKHQMSQRLLDRLNFQLTRANLVELKKLKSKFAEALFYDNAVKRKKNRGRTMFQPFLFEIKEIDARQDSNSSGCRETCHSRCYKRANSR